MAEDLDSVARYGLALGIAVQPRTVLVEGTTDVGLFLQAAASARDENGVDLLSDDLAIVAAGERDRGGTHGVIRELVSLRGIARTCLLPNGRPRYRFIGLFDNDKAGKQAVNLAREIDNSILEYKDVFRLWPVMPLPGNVDPGTVKKTFERENDKYRGLEWELEDLVAPDFFDAFISDNPMAVARTTSTAGMVHRDLTPDGKARFHRFVKQHAVHADLCKVIDTLKAIRCYFNLPAAEEVR